MSRTEAIRRVLLAANMPRFVPSRRSWWKRLRDALRRRGKEVA